MERKPISIMFTVSILVNMLAVCFSAALMTAPSAMALSMYENEGSDGFTYNSGNLTRMIIGVNRTKSNSYETLKELTTAFGGRIVDKVSIKNRIIALVIEIPSYYVNSISDVMKAEGLARYVELSRPLLICEVPNDPDYTTQWGPQKIKADWAWNYTKGSSNITVAIVDTGIDYNHTDLDANYISLGYDWLNNDTDPMDDQGHGTACAGVIAAEINNNIGIAGLAQIKIIAEKGIDYHGWPMESALANGIINATDAGANIISMSWGGYYDLEVIHEAIQYAYNNSVLLIAAAGNEGFNRKFYPAAYDEVIAVSATDINDALATGWTSPLHSMKAGSNHGNWIELAAPGKEIYSTYLNDTYTTKSGTSLAAPHVSGVAALIWSKYSYFERDSVRYWLRSTADDLGLNSFDSYFGNGRINARSAVEKTSPTNDLIALSLNAPPVVKANASRELEAIVLNFGTYTNHTDVEVQLLENGTLCANTTISSLPVGHSSVVDFLWTPSTGSYNLSLNVVPQLGEVNSTNNLFSKNVIARFPSVLNVPSQYANITSALHETIPKDTINVSTGLYNESILIETVNLKLAGQGSDLTTIQGSLELSYVINIGADNVTVTGFNIIENPSRNKTRTVEAYEFNGINISFNNVKAHGNKTSWTAVRLKKCSNCIIAGNNITATSIRPALELNYSNKTEVFHNTLNQSKVGLVIAWASNNTVSHNNFVNNSIQQGWVVDADQNTWDAGYPLGGNYWSDYNGSDSYSGPYQNETGSDGIGDTPYTIHESENITDPYPLMNQLSSDSKHNIVILSLTSNETHVTPGEIVKITVKVQNQGNFTESFTVSANAYNTTEEINYSVGTQNVTSLAPSSNETLTFNWNTTDVVQNVTFTIKAEAEVVLHEGDIADNTYVDGTVFIRSYNNPPQTPLTPEGPTPIYTGQSWNYNSTTSDPDSDQVWYEFDWDDDTTTEIGPYGSNVTGYYAAHTWVHSGIYNVTVRARDKFHDYSNWSDSHAVTVNHAGGCPFVYVWNGTEFVIDNNLVTGSAKSNGTEVEDYYRLEQDLVPLFEGYFNSYYSLKISEFQQEHSYFDQVQLFAVDHQANVSVAASSTGEILTYQDPYPPITAVDEANVSWLAELSEIDGEYYEGYDGSFLVLNFGEVTGQTAKLVFQTDPPPPGDTKTSIYIQVLNSSESWVDVVSIIPRTYWATDIIDLSDYLLSDGELVVRFYFTFNHRVGFVGLDTTPQAEIDVEDANLLLAYHSEEGFVTAALRSDDDVYAELVPDQQITLLFSAPKPDAEARTFIFYVKGYYTITG